jgi:hypothetical protein
MAGLLASVCARAEDRAPVSLDWSRLTEAFRAGGAVLSPEAPALAPARGHRGGPGVEGRLDASDASLTAGRDAWMRDVDAADGEAGGGPDASLVARDWGGPRAFVGHLSTTDRIRLSHSSRMLVGRLRLPAGRVTPFAQLGLGQWRIDTELLPHRPDTSYAAQLGYGFELSVASFATVGFEADYTILYRDQPCPSQGGPPTLWGAFLAARGRF